MNEQEIFLREHFDSIKVSMMEDYGITELSYNTWLKPLHFLGMEGTVAIIGVPEDKYEESIRAIYAAIDEAE